MNSRGNEYDENVVEDAKGEEETLELQGRAALLFRENVAAREALAAQLSANAPFQGTGGQQNTLEALQLQLLRQGGSGLPLGSIAPGPPLLSGLQANATTAAANLREARLRLLLHQQQQQFNQQILQQQQLSQMQQQQQQHQQVQNQNLLAHLTRTGGTQPSHSSFSDSIQASSNLNAHLAMRGLGGLGGLPNERAFNLPLGGGDINSLPSLLTGNAMASLPMNLRAQQPPQVASVAAWDSRAGTGVARMPEAQGRPAEDEQPEMKDGEYFELFGFNDEDGVQIINETFPHKLYRMLFEVEKKGQEDIVSFFPHGKAFIVHKPKAFVGKPLAFLPCFSFRQIAVISSILTPPLSPHSSTDEIMPKYFSTTRMSSFQRQLNLYGFQVRRLLREAFPVMYCSTSELICVLPSSAHQRIDDGPEKGGFVHQYFQKGQRSLCNKIKRQKNRSQAVSAPPAPAEAPLGVAGRGGPQAMAGTLSSAQEMSQNQQAQVLLQQMLNQQDQQQNRETGNNPR